MPNCSTLSEVPFKLKMKIFSLIFSSCDVFKACFWSYNIISKALETIVQLGDAKKMTSFHVLYQQPGTKMFSFKQYKTEEHLRFLTQENLEQCWAFLIKT